MTSITRRALLELAPAAALILLLPFPGYPPGTAAGEGGEFSRSELSQIVGEYLHNFPEERDPHQLANILEIEFPASADLSLIETPVIVSRIQKDFEEERTVSAGGWILSRTEVRCLALLDLLRQPNR